MQSFRLVLTAFAIVVSTVSAQRQVDAEKTILDQIQEKRAELFDGNAIESLVNQFTDVVGFLTQNEAHRTEAYTDHLQRGALRSGQGSPLSVFERVKTFEESERLIEIEENKEVVADPTIALKLYERFQQRQKNRVGTTRNDGLDLTPIDQDQSQDLDSGEYIQQGRSLAAKQFKKKAEILSLDEPYPKHCQNNGQLSPIIQVHYFCRNQKVSKGEQFRVTRETFQLLKKDQDYICSHKNITKNVCVCPKGYGDFECSTALYTKCFINIVEPAFDKGCEGVDTPYYLYSIPSYDPCFFLNFSRSYEVVFNLQCKVIDEYGLGSMKTEQAGYAYRDVVVDAKPYQPFNYVSTNPETQFTVMGTDSYIVKFDFRDFKYLSNVMTTQIIISDPEVLVGLKNASIEVDFPGLMESDAAGHSRFVNGGRVYFEANLFGYQTFSFTTKGFFDQLGYVEPLKPFIQKERLNTALSGVLIIAILSMLLYAIRFCLRKPKVSTGRNGQTKLHQD